MTEFNSWSGVAGLSDVNRQEWACGVHQRLSHSSPERGPTPALAPTGEVAGFAGAVVQRGAAVDVLTVVAPSL